MGNHVITSCFDADELSLLVIEMDDNGRVQRLNSRLRSLGESVLAHISEALWRSSSELLVLEPKPGLSILFQRRSPRLWVAFELGSAPPELRRMEGAFTHAASGTETAASSRRDRCFPGVFERLPADSAQACGASVSPAQLEQSQRFERAMLMNRVLLALHTAPQVVDLLALLSEELDLCEDSRLAVYLFDTSRRFLCLLAEHSHAEPSASGATLQTLGWPLKVPADDAVSPDPSAFLWPRNEAASVAENGLYDAPPPSLSSFPVLVGREVVGTLLVCVPEPLDAQQRGILDTVRLALGPSIARMRTERALQSSEQLFRDITQASYDAFFVCTQDGTVLFANRAAQRWTANAARPCTLWSLFAASLRSCIQAKFEEALAQADGREHAAQAFFLEFGTEQPGFPVSPPGPEYCERQEFELQCYALHLGHGQARVAATIRDISARRREEQFRLRSEREQQRVQKLETLSRMSAGIAREFSRLLMGIVNHANRGVELASMGEDNTDELLELMALSKAGGRLCRQLLAVGGEPIEPRRIDLTQLLRELSTVLEIYCPSHVSLSLLGESPVNVQADEHQLSQLILDLMERALDILGPHRRRLVLSTGSDAQGPFLALSGEAGEMDRQQFELARFEASTTSAILERHHARLQLELEHLPAWTLRVRFSSPHEPAFRGEEHMPETDDITVLFVDDEAAVTHAWSRILEKYGYRVLVANSGAACLQLVRELDASLGVILLDLNLPDATSAELLDELRLLQPQTPVLVVSGYSEEHIRQTLPKQHFAGIIQKPFRTQTLLDGLRSAVENAGRWQR
ncbi:MAG: response regulator [Myxococcota bacterium]|jgi:CheY-like chemotaxis protein/PAS domain-containing protein|nr:response regulator [Myxococcota bacterium]